MIKFIESKLRPPVLKPNLIKRERLTERLRSNLGLSATFLCAGPGWGKTTLAAEFIADCERASVWYDLDSSDADIAAFLQYLVRAVRQAVPEFGRNTLEWLASGAGARPEQLADLLLYELSEDVDRDLIIVLDNIHHAFAADWSAPLLYRILQLLPENIHLLLLARVAPPFTFSRMRSKQSMDQIDDRMLALTRSEALELIGGVLGQSDTVDKLLEWTQGWVAGVQIIRQALEADEQLRERDIEKIITRSEADIFDYFAEMVYRAKTEPVRALLVRSALPRRITPDLLNEAFDLNVSNEQLQTIVRENIFLSRVAGETDTFIYHPLFRDFLCKQLEEETTPQERARMHQRLARYYAAREEWGLALRHFFEAGDEADAAKTLLAAQHHLLSNGLTLTLASYFPRFQSQTLEAHPQLYNLMADVHVIECDSAKAEAMFQAALAMSRRLEDQAAEVAALAGLAHVAARDRKFEDAIRYAEEAERRAPEMDFLQAATLAARVKNVIGAVRSFEGRYKEANDMMEEALRMAHEAGDQRMVRTISHNLALPAFMEGDFRAALRYFSRTPISDMRGSADRQIHPDLAILYVNRAAIYTALGELSMAEQDLDRAAQVAAVFNLRNYMPGIYEGRANIARERRRFDEADRLYNDALDEYRRVDADPVRSDLYYERALMEMRRGEIDQALELINMVVINRNESSRKIEEAIARQLRARILAERDPLRALVDADAGDGLLRRLQCNYYLAISCYLRARLLAGVDEAAGRRALAEFLSLAERFDYRYFLACEEYYHPAIGEMCRLYRVSSEWLERVFSSLKLQAMRFEI